MRAAIKNSSPGDAAKEETSQIATYFSNGAWQAAYASAGSALERVLVAYFARGQRSRPMGLQELTEACRHDRRLMKHAVDIATVVQGYRTIDTAPGIGEAAMRLSAAHAISVFEKVRSIVAGQAAEPRQATTAEEIVVCACNPKVEQSSVHDLVRTADAKELRRLLLGVIPAGARILLPLGDPSVAEMLARLRGLFDLAFCFADDDIKNAVVNTFVAALDEQNSSISTARQAFFRPKYLQYFEARARKRMLRHLLGRLRQELLSPPLDLVDGVEEFLFDDDDLLVWLQAVVIASLAAPAERAGAIRKYAKRAYSGMGPAQKRIIAEKHAAVLRDCDREGNHGLGRLLRNLQDEWAMVPVDSAKAAVG